MTAAEAREELEAALWHLAGMAPETARALAALRAEVASESGTPLALVDAALAAADKYASAIACDVLDSVIRVRRQADRRAVLADAIGAAA